MSRPYASALEHILPYVSEMRPFQPMSSSFRPRPCGTAYLGFNSLVKCRGRDRKGSWTAAD